ncbi:cytochrome c peroxidase [Pontiellaceae bacterium B12227]|nr:cytochrome c peroxidase [Pontiellaceae bacterium B12227]
MRLKQCAAFCLGLVACAVNAVMVPGQTIGIDFGGTAPSGTYSFNQMGPYGGNNTTLGVPADAVLTTASLVDITGVAVADVGFSVANADQIAWDITGGVIGDGGFLADSSVYADGLICNDASGRATVAGVDFMYFTFTGLNDSLTYNLSAGWDNGNANFDATWSADGQSVTTDVNGSGGGYASLTNLTTDGSGNLVVSLTGDGSTAHMTVSAMTLTADGAAVTILAVGDGVGYDATPAQSQGWRSTSVDKGTLDDGDQAFGTDGSWFVCNGTAATPTDLTPAWVTSVTKLGGFTSGMFDAYTDFDNPTLPIAATVSDWTSSAFTTTLADGWQDVLSFDITTDAPNIFRVGVMGGNEGNADGRWDPLGLRISFESGTPVEYTSLPATDLGMVFFDVEVTVPSSGTVLIQTMRRTDKGGGVVGLTFDMIEDLLPHIDNDSGVSNLLGNAATLTGTLTSTGGAPTQVWACWGESDGGTNNIGDWAQSIDLGLPDPGGFSVQVTNLTTDTAYGYRCAASNQYGMTWSELESFTPSYPVLTVDPVQIAEGNSGTTLALFTVRLSRTYPAAVNFTFSTVDGLAGSADYDAQSGALAFLPGETEKQIAITIWGDAVDEGDEDFYLNIDSADGAVIANGSVRGVIFSDDRNNYLSPSELVADAGNGLLYVAESTAGRIGIVDLEQQTRLGSIDLPQDPSGLALSADGSTLYVTAGGSVGEVYVVDTASKLVTQTIPVGHTPLAPVLASGNRLYVCERFFNTVAVVDLGTGTNTDRIAVLREPHGAVLTPDGTKLLVGNLLPHQPSIETGIAASVSVIDTATGLVTTNILLPPGSHSLRDLAVSPDGSYAVVAHALGRYRVPANQIFRGWVNTSALSLIDLSSDTLYNTVDIDDLDEGAANPWGIGFSDDAATLCIAHAGTHELSAIDWPALLTKLSSATKNVCDDLSYLAGLRRRLPMPGNGPRDLAMVGSKVYTANYFSDSVSVADLTEGQEYAAEEIAIGWVMPQSDVRFGKQLFHDATLSAQQWQSCTSCHPDGRIDGLNWDLLNDGFGNSKNVKSLLQAHYTAPTTWTGVRPNAETSVRAGIMFSHMINWKNDEDLYLDAFLKAEQPVPSPYLVDGELSAAAVRGQTIFNARCTGCHSGTYLTDQSLHDVGTGTAIDAGPFDTPSLIEVWRTAPYLHDGRAQTIDDVVEVFSHGSTSGLSETEIDDLVEYVKSL